jgi:hypothetical protein
MRKILLYLVALTASLLTLGACVDSPTLWDQQPRAPVATSSPAGVQDAQVQGCVTEGTCVLPPISGGGCDEWDYSCAGDDCIASTGHGDPGGTTVQGCDGGGGDGGGDYDGGGGSSGGGGGSGGTKGPLCPDTGCSSPPPPDTCKTGEQVVDAPGVSGQFQALWLESRLKGVEKGGWVVSNGTSLRLVPFQNATFTACGIDLYEAPPAGTVSLVHTHPWPLWTVNPCGYVNTGTPSQEDVQALQLTGLSTGYFLDDNGIGKFTSTGGQTATRIDRCGY